MIVVNYEEKTTHPTSGVVTHQALGSETHDKITEVLLPGEPSATDPIFFTKKFSQRSEYRWEVVEVSQDYSQSQKTYLVTLSKREQVRKDFYLNNILKAKRVAAKKILFPNAIVEVEYGHAMDVGDEDGEITSNKRYVDSVQRGSMPKRRLAIVNQIIERPDQELIQVILISSRRPLNNASSLRMVDVTDCLCNLVHYQKQSWAICEMIETVAPSRVMAPLRRKPSGPHGQPVEQRDIAFATKISPSMRNELRDALMYAVAQEFRVTTASALDTKIASEKALQKRVGDLSYKVTVLEANLANIAAGLDMTLEALLAAVMK
ncbi:MAG: hypothetical protein RXS25_07325 [Paraburkholderia sp.]|uniref:hypothetical protein n=1 Tax=Paraburkholderia sp. TaxID=1926495 RepID=UPI0039793D22